MKQKIWIDLTNSPHVLFFRPIIESLEGYDIKISAREHSQTIELLEMSNLNYQVIGRHGGKSKIKKAVFAMNRGLRLLAHFLKEKPDIVLTHQSPYAMVAAFLGGIKKRIYVFDNETAKLQNLLAIPFSTKAICPEAISKKKIYGKKLIKYSGLKEGIYLKEFKPDKSVLKELNLNKKYAVIRPEPSTAIYYSGEFNIPETINVLLELDYDIVILPRDEAQKKEFKKIFKDNEKIKIPEKIVDGPSLIYFADLVISGGGTMNREACVLGKKVISTYSGKLLEVDKFLIENGILLHAKDLDEVKKLMDIKIKNNENLFPDKKHLLDLILN